MNYITEYVPKVYQNHLVQKKLKGVAGGFSQLFVSKNNFSRWLSFSYLVWWYSFLLPGQAPLLVVGQIILIREFRDGGEQGAVCLLRLFLVLVGRRIDRLVEDVRLTKRVLIRLNFRKRAVGIFRLDRPGVCFSHGLVRLELGNPVGHLLGHFSGKRSKRMTSAQIFSCLPCRTTAPGPTSCSSSSRPTVWSVRCSNVRISSQAYMKKTD